MYLSLSLSLSHPERFLLVWIWRRTMVAVDHRRIWGWKMYMLVHVYTCKLWMLGSWFFFFWLVFLPMGSVEAQRANKFQTPVTQGWILENVEGGDACTQPSLSLKCKSMLLVSIPSALQNEHKEVIAGVFSCCTQVLCTASYLLDFTLATQNLIKTATNRS